MHSLYDNASFNTSLTGVKDTGGSKVSGTAVDTLGYNSGVFFYRQEAATGSPTTISTVIGLEECATSGGSYAAALENNGGQIGATTITNATAATEVVARIEGLGLNRMRYFKMVQTTTFTGGTTPAVVVHGVIALARKDQLPVTSAVSNT